MFCSSCSQSVNSMARFCSCCGRPLYSQAPYPAGPLVRPVFGRMIAGVCAGFANAYKLDVTLTRIVVSLLALFSGGTVFVAYIIAWVVMPPATYAVPTTVPTGAVTS